jgi:hypothetical protein
MAVDNYDVTEDLKGADELYDKIGDGTFKPGEQIVYIDRYSIGRNAKTQRPQLIINILGADDLVDNRACEAMLCFKIVTPEWVNVEPEVKRFARFLKGFFEALGIKDFKVTKLGEYLDGMLKMPFKAKIRVSGDFVNADPIGFVDGVDSTKMTDLPF